MLRIAYVYSVDLVGIKNIVISSTSSSFWLLFFDFRAHIYVYMFISTVCGLVVMGIEYGYKEVHQSNILQCKHNVSEVLYSRIEFHYSYLFPSVFPFFIILNKSLSLYFF